PGEVVDGVAAVCEGAALAVDAAEAGARGNDSFEPFLGEHPVLPESPHYNEAREGALGLADEGLGPDDLREARPRVARAARITPLLPAEGPSFRFAAPLRLKCENLQAGGAFKIRGATNFTSRLDEAERARGLITYSSGNHAIAVALAA